MGGERVRPWAGAGTAMGGGGYGQIYIYIYIYIYMYILYILSETLISKKCATRCAQGVARFSMHVGFPSQQCARFSPQTSVKICSGAAQTPARLVARFHRKVRRKERRKLFAADIPSVARSRRKVRRKVPLQGVARFSSQRYFGPVRHFVQ